MRNKEVDTLYIASPRLNQLNIAKELAADPYLTQSELARRCRLSVSMVNNYLKELCSIGWLEYHRRSSKDISYHLTAQGLQELDDVQHELIHEMVDLFATAKDRIMAAILRGTGRKPRCVAVCGGGNLAQLACDALQSSGIEVVLPFHDAGITPDVLVMALEFPWALNDVQRVLDYADEHGIEIVRLNGHVTHAPREAAAEHSEAVVGQPGIN